MATGIGSAVTLTPAPVSVIIPAFNAAATLDAALASVAAQTTRPSAVVVADDCSIDQTAEVAERWDTILPLRVVRMEMNGGPAAARRAAIAETDTQLLALLDSDDVWFPDHLDGLLRTHEHSGGITCSDALRWHPGDGIRPVRHGERYPVPAPELQATGIVHNNFVSIGALFGREAYDAAGGFRDGFSGAEDWDLWIRMIRSGLRVHAAPGTTLLYRVVASGLSHGAGILGTYVRVLEAARREAADDAEREAIEKGLRWYRARARLARAQDAARSGPALRARIAAARCVRGPARMALEAVLIVASPSLGVRAGDAARRGRW